MSRRVTRRRFLQGLAASGVGLSSGMFARPAYAAAAWGDYPAYAAAAQLPESKRAKNVLEVFMYGGLCPWETFYVVPEYGRPEDPVYPNQQWWTFQDGKDGVAAVYGDCKVVTPPPMLQELGVDDLGALVHLGPFTEPLRSRADIRERLRVHVVTHSLEPHEAAIPYAMSGFRLGQPKLAGLGAAVQHYHQAHAPVIDGEPFSYVLYSPGDFPTDNLRAASAVGLHPGASRPLSIRVSDSLAFVEALKRNTVGELKPSFDALINHYRGQYASRMTWPGAPSAVRSKTWADFEFSLDTLQQTGVLVDILQEQYFEAQMGEACGDVSLVNFPNMGLKLAAHLLTRPGSKARYVSVVDGGLIPASGGGGYDTHNAHIRDSARNLTNLFTELTAVINEPGEGDPGKLNLDETLIVLNTEFGRSPGAQNGDGRNHWPYAYTTVMFGGPVGPDQQGIVGAIGPDSLAVGALHPAESRAAILSALGIYPFAPECYAVSDIFGASDETTAGILLNEVVLGVKS